MLPEDVEWERAVHGMFRQARRAGWTRQQLWMTVLWRTANARDRRALMLSACAEGWIELCAEDCQRYDTYTDLDVAMRLPVASKLTELDALLLRARTLAADHRAELRSVGLGRG